MQKRPIFSVLVTTFAIIGYSNLFYYGFRLAIPVALRPFLDAHFFSSLTFEFFATIAVAAILSRCLVLLSRFVLSTFPGISMKHFPDFSISYFMREFAIPKTIIFIINPFFLVKSNDRLTQLRLRLTARWIRRQKFVTSIVVGVLIFGFLFLGKHSLWYFLVVLLSGPLVWVLFSRVELRRNFATFENTSQFSSHRMYNALLAFCVVYIGLWVFLAGVASFQHRIDTQVSVGVESSQRDTSLIAVTASGVIVADRSAGSSLFYKPLSVSAYFLPFDTLSSIGQRH